MCKKDKKRNLSINYKPKYAIVDEKGKVLDKFRLILSAKTALWEYKSNYPFSELRIITLY